MTTTVQKKVVYTKSGRPLAIAPSTANSPLKKPLLTQPSHDSPDVRSEYPKSPASPTTHAKLGVSA